MDCEECRDCYEDDDDENWPFELAEGCYYDVVEVCFGFLGEFGQPFHCESDDDRED